MLLRDNDEIHEFENAEQALQHLVDNDDDLSIIDGGYTPELLTFMEPRGDPFSQLEREWQLETLQIEVLTDAECTEIAKEACEAEAEFMEGEANTPADAHLCRFDSWEYEVRDRIEERVNEAAFEATCEGLIQSFVIERIDYTRDEIYRLWDEYDPRNDTEGLGELFG